MSSFLALFLIVSGFCYGQSLDKASELAESGNTADAALEYFAWLEENPDSPDFVKVAIRAADLETEIRKKTGILYKALDKESGPEERHRLYRLLGELEEISGNPVSSQRHYQAASFAVPGKKDFDSLLRSALLLIELGEYRSAEAQAKAITETCRDEYLVSGAAILLSRVFFATEREQKAIDLFDETDFWENNGVLPEGLLWIYELATHLEQPDLSQRALAALLEHYPDSPEYAMLSGKAEYFPSPSAFMHVLADIDTEPVAEPVDVIPEEASTTVSIQTGSYSIKENAEYAAADLEDEGFSAKIVERTIDGKTYYRVIVPEINSAELQNALLELKEKGFEGFPLYE